MHTGYASSDLSSLSSDDEANRPATEKEVAAAYFSQPSLYVAEPRADARLRKNESAYSNRRTSPASAILPMAWHAGGASYADPTTPFDTLAADDGREVVGHLTGADGKPYAEIREKRPPPPNVNRQGQSHQHSLRRALGYDPHYAPSKGETEGITNAHDAMNGDALVATARRDAKMTMEALGDAYHNQAHTQSFADQDTRRGATYEGYNVSGAARQFQASRRPVEHTWRTTHGTYVDPTRAQGQTTQVAPAHAEHVTHRTETAPVFARAAVVGDHSTVQLDSTMDLPAIAHASRREGDGRAHAAHAEHVTHRAEPTAKERADPHAELSAALRDGSSPVVSARRVAPHTDVVLGEREIEGLFGASFATEVVARQVPAGGAQREGTDAVATTRKADASSALAGLGGAQHAQGKDRCEEAEHEAAARPEEGGRYAAAAAHAPGKDRCVEDEVAGATPRVDGSTAVGGTTGDVRTLGGTDGRDVSSTTRAAHTEAAAAAPARGHDVADSDRAVATTRVPHAETGGVHAAAVVHIGDDRPPASTYAAWHFTPAGSGETTAAPSHAAQGKSRAEAGAFFVDDRLDQPHAADWRRQEQRVGGGSEEEKGADRATPILHVRGATPVPHAARTPRLTSARTSAETPRAPQPSPAALR